ncbi:MAG: Flp pilus assembly complex ATPase component TadA [Planctomycetes bacterium]|nr:Flp pilus assembly complex ATPase component TadA [Planctomycetota bacterium]
MALIHVSEPGRQRMCELKDGTIKIGRTQTSHICLHDVNASRRHCRIVREGDQWVLQDQRSQTGTEVNGDKVSNHVLKDGDVIQIAQAVLTFYDRPGAGDPARRQKATERRIGEMCVEKGLVTQENVKAALEVQKKTGQKLGEILTARGLVSPREVVETLGEQLATPCIDLTQCELDPKTLALFTRAKALVWHAMPILHLPDSKRLVVAMADPTNFQVIEEIEFFTRCTLEVILAVPQDLVTAIEAHYPPGPEEENLLQAAVAETKRNAPTRQVPEPQDGAEARAVSKLVTAILEEAVRQGASDIHIEPKREHMLVRFRIDGILVERRQLPKALQAAVTNRLKIMGRMDISEKRIPQDGRYTFKMEGRDVDLRVASLPSMHGEKLVMRIVNRSQAHISFDDLGMDEEVRRTFFELLRKPEGMLVVTGPTGSGKTSTLYAALNYLQNSERNLVSLEDPIEVEFAGVTQAQVYDHPDFTFASGLRAILRQDPNVIMVGEIRDRETAQIAVQAGMTGHVVLSSLHTNSAPTAIPRLIDMGIEPYLLTASLIGVLAQRLVRVICVSCRVEDHPPEEVVRTLIPNLQGPPPRFFRGQGCSRCLKGYRGRIGVFELLVCDEPLQRLVARSAQSPELRQKAREQGMQTLRDDAIRKALSGVTTIDEVLRVTCVE